LNCRRLTSSFTTTQRSWIDSDFFRACCISCKRVAAGATHSISHQDYFEEI
jgi:hypothetical protein